MPSLGIFDKTSHLLKKVLDLRQQNQQVIASNIANAETPGYAPSQLSSEKELAGAAGHNSSGMVATDPRHIPLSQGGVDRVEGRVTRTPDRSGIGDGNNVSVDQEMLALAENQLLYEAAVQMLNKKMGLIKYAAQDGR